MKRKYPRTMHLPWSPGLSNDDKRIDNMDNFINRLIIITEKRDGENITMTKNYIHSRSLDWKAHESRDWIQAYWNKIRWEIPENLKIHGESLYAKHSIGYEHLTSYFECFAVFDEETDCFLSWQETCNMALHLEMQMVPLIYEGMYEKDYWTTLRPGDKNEGYVVRLEDEIPLNEFQISVAKYVRANHVNEDEKHWFYNKEIVKNKLVTGE